MRKKSYIWVNIVIYIYMVLPTLIFVIGWLRWYWALGFSVLISFACLRGFMDSAQNNYWVIEENYKTFLKALLFIVGWVYLSGIGGWCYQTVITKLEVQYFVPWWNMIGQSFPITVKED